MKKIIIPTKIRDINTSNSQVEEEKPITQPTGQIFIKNDGSTGKFYDGLVNIREGQEYVWKAMDKVVESIGELRSKLDTLNNKDDKFEICLPTLEEGLVTLQDAINGNIEDIAKMNNELTRVKSELKDMKSSAENMAKCHELAQKDLGNKMLEMDNKMETIRQILYENKKLNEQNKCKAALKIEDIEVKLNQNIQKTDACFEAVEIGFVTINKALNEDKEDIMHAERVIKTNTELINQNHLILSMELSSIHEKINEDIRLMRKRIENLSQDSIKKPITTLPADENKKKLTELQQRIEKIEEKNHNEPQVISPIDHSSRLDILESTLSLNVEKTNACFEAVETGFVTLNLTINEDKDDIQEIQRKLRIHTELMNKNESKIHDTITKEVNNIREKLEKLEREKSTNTMKEVDNLNTKTQTPEIADHKRRLKQIESSMEQFILEDKKKCQTQTERIAANLKMFTCKIDNLHLEIEMTNNKVSTQNEAVNLKLKKIINQCRETPVNKPDDTTNNEIILQDTIEFTTNELTRIRKDFASKILELEKSIAKHETSSSSTNPPVKRDNHYMFGGVTNTVQKHSTVPHSNLTTPIRLAVTPTIIPNLKPLIIIDPKS